MLTPHGGRESHRAAPMFVPRLRASQRRRLLLWLLGPVLWSLLIAAVAIVIHHLYSVELALMVTGGALVVGVVAMAPVAMRRNRRGQR